MRWCFRKCQPGEKIREPVHGEFFSTDAIQNVAEALIREAIQNSLDAAVDENSMVKIRFFLGKGPHAVRPRHAHLWFEHVWDHLRAPRNGLREAPKEAEPCPYLVIEDFGTRGLCGDPAQSFDTGDEANDFFYFFRAEGRSGKSAQKIGRWGIGKQVFARASRANMFFGFTHRYDDSRELLMGQVVLKSHPVGKDYFAPDGYFGTPADDGMVMPVDDEDSLNRFRLDFNLERERQPGLSIVVPWIDEDVTKENLLEAVLAQFYYPILSGKLSVTIAPSEGSLVLDADSLGAMVEQRDLSLRDDLVTMIKLAQFAAFCKPKERFDLNPPDDPRNVVAEDWIPAHTLPNMRQCFHEGKKIAVRVPFAVREKNGAPRRTFFDICLQQDNSEGGRPVFIRRGIIISDVRAPRVRGVRSLVIAEDPPICEFLGDAENPAHTQWQRDSSHFRGKYDNGPAWLAFVVKSVSSLVSVLRSEEGRVDRDLLREFFPRPMSDSQTVGPEPPAGPGTAPGSNVKLPRPPHTEPKPFTISRVSGGFEIKGDCGQHETGRVLEVRVAYDVRRGDPLHRYRPEDFDLSMLPIRLDPPPEGLNILTLRQNRIEAEITCDRFVLRVHGFDAHRDLLVWAQIRVVDK